MAVKASRGWYSIEVKKNEYVFLLVSKVYLTFAAQEIRKSLLLKYMVDSSNG